MNNKTQIQYNIYLQDDSLERKLGDVVFDTTLLSSIMPPDAKLPYKIVNILVTVEYS